MKFIRNINLHKFHVSCQIEMIPIILLLDNMKIEIPLKVNNSLKIKSSYRSIENFMLSDSITLLYFQLSFYLKSFYIFLTHTHLCYMTLLLTEHNLY